jgi:NADPH:quinone reductase-like Zn-dependent oxidoreductase
VFIRQGLYRDRPGLPQPPYVPGLEVAGTVRALGQGVAGFEAGEPVVTLSAGSGTGGYAAILVSDAAYVASLKDVNLDPALAVAVVPNGATAYLALTQIARIDSAGLPARPAGEHFDIVIDPVGGSIQNRHSGPHHVAWLRRFAACGSG